MDSMGLTRYMSVLMDDAMKQARFFDHEFVMPEHMLLALLRQYAFCQALQEEGVDSLKMHEDLVEWLAKQERVPETIKYLPEPSSLFKTMFGTACALAAAADRQLVNVPHFVQAMFGLQNSEAAFLLCKNVGDRQGEFLASVDSYYPIGEDTGEAGMGMGADFDDDDYANEDRDYNNYCFCKKDSAKWQEISELRPQDVNFCLIGEHTPKEVLPLVYRDGDNSKLLFASE